MTSLRDYVIMSSAASNKYCLTCKKSFRQPLEDFVCSTCKATVVPEFETYLKTQGLQPPPAHDDDDDASQNESAPSPRFSESDVEVSDMDDDHDDQYFVDSDGNEVHARDKPEDFWEEFHSCRHSAMRKAGALFSCRFVPAQKCKECVFKFQPDDSTGSFPTVGKRAKFFNDSRAIYWFYGPHLSGKTG